VRGVAAVRGAAVPWSVFVKVLRSPHGLRLPSHLSTSSRERLRAMAATDRTWRHEADVYRADLDGVLPAGLRMPARYRIEEHRSDEQARIVEWLEDVPAADLRWDPPRFARAARLLGRLAVRLARCDRLPDSLLRVPGEVLRLQFLERELFMLPVPAADPDTFVAVNWSLMGPCAVGYDLRGAQRVLGAAPRPVRRRPGRAPGPPGPPRRRPRPRTTHDRPLTRRTRCRSRNCPAGRAAPGRPPSRSSGS
jgi:hypothetical protein